MAKIKKVKKIIRLNLPAGTATPAPPVGPILGQAGINMMDFIKQYNDRTQDKRGQIIPAELTVYQDSSFTFELKLPPVSAMIKQVLKLKSGSQKPGVDSAGSITKAQIKEIAQKKLPDLNTNDLEAAMRCVEGSAKSMGIDII
ncbi:50S ribosomal protein L11 [Patescibacteria group bacterium]|nr:50S ribosomal protein L11 [Patescibacteria group bacterium]MBU1885812.1 50S ribosomal protein L11 [Patescibacteria group bacterium]